jgi:hypothetical protein
MKKNRGLENCKEDSKILSCKISAKGNIHKKKKSKDLDNICRVEELVGSLQTNKSTLSYQKKGKSIALKYVKKERVYSFDNDINSEDISLVDRKFRKFMFKKKNNIKDNRGKDFAKRNESKNDI